MPEATDFSPAYFDEMAALEDRHPWTRAMRALMLQLIRRHAPARLDRALDAGCGTGRFLCELKQFARLAAGADLFHIALLKARDRCPAEWLRASASDLPFPSRSFDLVHSADVLQHLSLAENERALDGFAEILKPAGLLALRVRSPKLLSRDPDVDYSHSFLPARLRAALQERGFQILFLSRVNALPSIAGELRGRGEKSGGAVGGITVSANSRLLDAYLTCERAWLMSLGIAMPFGHTTVCLARKL